MPKQGQRQPVEKSEKTRKRAAEVADGGKTRASRPRSKGSGSDSNASSKTRGH